MRLFRLFERPRNFPAITRVAATAIVFVFGAAGGNADDRSPTTFEGLPGARMPIEGATELERSIGDSLSISPDGAYFALARRPGVVDIWSTRDKRRAATIRLTANDDKRLANVVLLSEGSRCIVVAGVGPATDISKTATPEYGGSSLGLWECDTGKRISRIQSGSQRELKILLDLVALPSCGLAVALYVDRVVVLDVARRALAPNLGRLFDEARDPNPINRRGLKAIAASPDDDACITYGLEYEFDAQISAFAPRKLYEFDLGAARVRVARSFYQDAAVRQRDWARYAMRLAVSPSRRFAAMAPPRLSNQIERKSDLLIIDLKEDEPGAHFLMPPGATIAHLSFLTDDVLLFATVDPWMMVNTESMLFDRQTQRLHSICSVSLGEADMKKGNPRALAVNAKLSLLAVSMRDEARAYHYSVNEKGQWTGLKDCVDD